MDSIPIAMPCFREDASETAEQRNIRFGKLMEVSATAWSRPGVDNAAAERAMTAMNPPSLTMEFPTSKN